MIKHLRNYSLLEDGSIFKHFRIVPESTMLIGSRITLHNWKGLLRIRFSFAAKKLSTDVIYLVAHHSYSGYYHWLLETLPKLLEAQATLTKFTLLMPARYVDNFYAETLRLLNISSVVKLEPGIVYKVPELMLAYSTVTMGTYNRDELLNLKDKLFSELKPQLVTSKDKRKLYVSRKLATRRKVLNEEDIEVALVEKGFEIICFEDYTFEQQIRICAEAELIISIHGAGLANMIFQPQDAHVIELRKFDNGLNTFFSELANTLGLHYDLLYCKSDDENGLVQDVGLIVDVKALLALIS